jgi:hypothetical protein
MRIDFDVAGVPGSFRRNAWTGTAELQVGDQSRTIRSPFQVSTHIELRTRVQWSQRIGQHEVVIVKTRPRFFGFARENSFNVIVDGVEVATATGR